MDKPIETLKDLCDYILKYKDLIFVREKINGKWGSYCLGKLPTDLALKNALEFIKRGVTPIRLKTEEEIGFDD